VVVVEGRALLIRRAKPPLQGRWTIPGGTVELGETLQEAVVREMAEETGLEVEPLEVLTVFDSIERGSEGTVEYHHVIVDFLCRYMGGEAQAASDALEARWVEPGDLASFGLTPKATEVLEEAFRRQALAWCPGEE
jgi:ADP-ribose pyrophosphatase YjhB (NUDIX family)